MDAQETVLFVNPITGEEKSVPVEVTTPELTEAAIVADAEEAAAISDFEVMSGIRRTKASPEFKSLLEKLKNFTIKIGKVVFSIGKKVVKLILKFIELFPMTSCMIVAAAILVAIGSFVPFIGFILSWIIAPMVAILATIGLVVDSVRNIMDLLKQNEKEKVVETVNADFRSMSPISVPA